MGVSSNKEEFIFKSVEIHGNKYIYDSVEYINSKIKVEIVCPEHGKFMQRPNDHLTGYGCKKCQYEKISKENKFNTEDFIVRANNKHNNLYDYSLVKYNGYENKIDIIYSKHGVFNQTPHAHLSGSGCPACKNSKGEKELARIFSKYNINFIEQKTFLDLKDVSNLYYDFYLPDHKLFIEYHGIQHWKPIEFFGGKKAFDGVRKRDIIKYKYAVDNGYEIAWIFNIPPKDLEVRLLENFRFKNIIK